MVGASKHTTDYKNGAGTVSGACLIAAVATGLMLFFRICPMKPVKLPLSEQGLTGGKKFKPLPPSSPCRLS
ncbi:hypothetical protein KIPB_011242 [Kipferlia bialata]|uniref:Uncharacterized protein n=1 Tax=Kipferlia bialata TaxID=797122 RepID=A0A9K3D5C9_9EUKA|nr:hypothetical protein KIPB_011242 [Kipferlia bialata]|eukprot:g11242.t1